MIQPKLSVLLAQYDRGKYRTALPALIRTIASLREVDPTFVVIDNRHEGDWTHEVSDNLVHIGGDNRAHEFSAFDRGLEFLRASGRSTDMYAFATDALLAYGEEYLALVDNNVIQVVAQLQACAGWMDSFGKECRIGAHGYDTWIRTSFFFVPASRLSTICPLATDLENLHLFACDSRYPFAGSADLSPNLQQLICEWLTTNQHTASQLSETWHSRFALTEATIPFFQAKASSIVREHLCSAKLHAAQIPCYDFRAIRRVTTEMGLGPFLSRGGSPSWQWLEWRATVGRAMKITHAGDSASESAA